MTGRLPERVLFVVAYPQRMAGANRSLFHLVTNLPEEIEPVVAVLGDGIVASDLRAAGVRCEVVPVTGHLGSYGKTVLKASLFRKAWIALRELLPLSFRLRRIVLDNGIDLIHANEPRAALLISGAALLTRKPLVAHLRGEFIGGDLLRRLYEAVSWRIICVSEGAERALSRRGRRKSTVVYNGIAGTADEVAPIPWLQALRQAGRVVVSCFASVVPFKGHHHLLAAVDELNRRGWRDSLTLVCVGDFSAGYEWYHEELRRIQAERELDNVQWVGWRNDPFSFYAASDVTVLASVTQEWMALGEERYEVHGNEGFPRTHLEAMQFGLPVVGTRIAGVPEQVADGVSGILVPPSDPGALADAIEALLADPEKRRAMGREGRQRVQELFSTTAYVEGVLDVYEGVFAVKGS